MLEGNDIVIKIHTLIIILSLLVNVGANVVYGLITFSDINMLCEVLRSRHLTTMYINLS